MTKVLNVFKKVLITFNTAGCAFIIILTLLIMTDVLGRLFFNKPLVGTAEIVQCGVVAIAFLMIPYVQLANRHLNVTVLYSKMSPRRGQLIVDCITCVLGIIMFSIIVYSGFDLFLKAITVGEYEGDGFNVKIPTAYIRGAIVICSAANVLTYALQLVKRIRGKEMAE